MTKHWLTRIIVGFIAPVPVATFVPLIVILQIDDSVTLVRLPMMYLSLAMIGYVISGLQCIVYSIIMELFVLRVPLIEKSILLYICFSALIAGISAIMTRNPMVPYDMLLCLRSFTGAAVAMILWPLTRQGKHKERVG